MPVRDVRASALRAPWWVLSIVAGLVFGTGQYLTFSAQGGSGLGGAVGAAVAGLVFGLIMGPLLKRQNRRFLAAQGDVPRGREKEVRQAVMRGPVPSDPKVRAAALRIVAMQLEHLPRLGWTALLWVSLIALSVWLVTTESLLWLVLTAVFSGLLAWQMWLPGHLRNRQRLLTMES